MAAPPSVLHTGLPESLLSDPVAAIRGPGDLVRFYHELAGSAPLLVVTNREPVVWKGGAERFALPPGGVSQTIHRLLCQVGGRWIALRDSGGPDLLRIPGEPGAPGYRLDRLEVPTALMEGHYAGFSNGVLWPFFHDEEGRIGEPPNALAAYREVNCRVAGKVMDSLRGGASGGIRPGMIWVHDYQLALVGQEMRRSGGALPPLAFFWHIPWSAPVGGAPPPRWLFEVVTGLLSYDQVGFQTELYRDRFLETVFSLYGSRASWDGETLSVATASGVRRLHPGVFPISVDPDHFRMMARDPAGMVPALSLLSDCGLAPGTPSGGYLISVDRMDYSKGFLERLSLMEALYENDPSLAGRLALLQIAPPTRLSVEAYRRYAEEVERRSEALNRRFARGAWRPVVTLSRSLDPSLLAPLYRLSRGCLVTATRDGMNLVAKEFLASQDGGSAPLFLSRHTGTAMTMEGLSLIDPADPALSARIVAQGLSMDGRIRERKNRQALADLREHNVYRWMAENLLRPLSRTSKEGAILFARPS